MSWVEHYSNISVLGWQHLSYSFATSANSDDLLPWQNQKLCHCMLWILIMMTWLSTIGVLRIKTDTTFCLCILTLLHVKHLRSFLHFVTFVLSVHQVLQVSLPSPRITGKYSSNVDIIIQTSVIHYVSITLNKNRSVLIFYQ